MVYKVKRGVYNTMTIILVIRKQPHEMILCDLALEKYILIINITNSKVNNSKIIAVIINLMDQEVNHI